MLINLSGDPQFMISSKQRYSSIMEHCADLDQIFEEYEILKDRSFASHLRISEGDWMRLSLLL